MAGFLSHPQIFDERSGNELEDRRMQSHPSQKFLSEHRRSDPKAFWCRVGAVNLRVRYPRNRLLRRGLRATCRLLKGDVNVINSFNHEESLPRAVPDLHSHFVIPSTN
ncbi:hypothetical protein CC2G_010714 [Coprinopsis cinerea AmutBmut pab1-1]|nr:hypothetical protein CC2G_010714 [Coprinopsis cinerea AmutBmut pab1-1]